MNLIFNFMNKKFFYYYLAVHLVVFSFILGLVVNAFTVLSGGAISVIPVSDERAVIGNGTIDSYIANATSTAYLKQAKRVAGGCEKWESTDFFRIQRWGAATSAPYASSSMICNCPSGFTKVQIRTRQEYINDFSSGNWYNRYSNWSGSSAVRCGSVTPTASHIQVNSCEHSAYGDSPGYNKFCFKLLCDDPDCACDKNVPCDTQQMSRRDNFFDFVFKIKPVMAGIYVGCDQGSASGCGFVSMCQYHPLSYSQLTTITTWLCVNTSTTSTVTGWDN